MNAPDAEANRARLSPEDRWDLPDGSAGTVLVAHALEHAPDPAALLARSLARAAVRPGSCGCWCRIAAASGHSRTARRSGAASPSARRSCGHWCDSAQFVPQAWRRALFLPPVKSRPGAGRRAGGGMAGRAALPALGRGDRAARGQAAARAGRLHGRRRGDWSIINLQCDLGAARRPAAGTDMNRKVDLLRTGRTIDPWLGPRIRRSCDPIQALERHVSLRDRSIANGAGENAIATTCLIGGCRPLS